MRTTYLPLREHREHMFGDAQVFVSTWVFDILPIYNGALIFCMSDDELFYLASLSKNPIVVLQTSVNYCAN